MNKIVASRTPVVEAQLQKIATSLLNLDIKIVSQRGRPEISCKLQDVLNTLLLYGISVTGSTVYAINTALKARKEWSGDIHDIDILITNNGAGDGRSAYGAFLGHTLKGLAYHEFKQHETRLSGNGLDATHIELCTQPTIGITFINQCPDKQLLCDRINRAHLIEIKQDPDEKLDVKMGNQCDLTLAQAKSVSETCDAVQGVDHQKAPKLQRLLYRYARYYVREGLTPLTHATLVHLVNEAEAEALKLPRVSWDRFRDAHLHTNEELMKCLFYQRDLIQIGIKNQLLAVESSAKALKKLEAFIYEKSQTAHPITKIEHNIRPTPWHITNLNLYRVHRYREWIDAAVKNQDQVSIEWALKDMRAFLKNENEPKTLQAAMIELSKLLDSCKELLDEPLDRINKLWETVKTHSDRPPETAILSTWLNIGAKRQDLTLLNELMTYHPNPESIPQNAAKQLQEQLKEYTKTNIHVTNKKIDQWVLKYQEKCPFLTHLTSTEINELGKRYCLKSTYFAQIWKKSVLSMSSKEIKTKREELLKLLLSNTHLSLSEKWIVVLEKLDPLTEWEKAHVLFEEFPKEIEPRLEKKCLQRWLLHFPETRDIRELLTIIRTDSIKPEDWTIMLSHIGKRNEWAQHNEWIRACLPADEKGRKWIEPRLTSKIHPDELTLWQEDCVQKQWISIEQKSQLSVPLIRILWGIPTEKDAKEMWPFRDIPAVKNHLYDAITSNTNTANEFPLDQVCVFLMHHPTQDIPDNTRYRLIKETTSKGQNWNVPHFTWLLEKPFKKATHEALRQQIKMLELNIPFESEKAFKDLEDMDKNGVQSKWREKLSTNQLPEMPPHVYVKLFEFLVQNNTKAKIKAIQKIIIATGLRIMSSLDMDQQTNLLIILKKLQLETEEKNTLFTLLIEQLETLSSKTKGATKDDCQKEMELYCLTYIQDLQTLTENLFSNNISIELLAETLKSPMDLSRWHHIVATLSKCPLTKKTQKIFKEIIFNLIDRIDEPEALEQIGCLLGRNIVPWNTSKNKSTVIHKLLEAVVYTLEGKETHGEKKVTAGNHALQLLRQESISDEAWLTNDDRGVAPIHMFMVMNAREANPIQIKLIQRAPHLLFHPCCQTKKPDKTGFHLLLNTGQNEVFCEAVSRLDDSQRQDLKLLSESRAKGNVETNLFFKAMTKKRITIETIKILWPYVNLEVLFPSKEEKDVLELREHYNEEYKIKIIWLLEQILNTEESIKHQTLQHLDATIGALIECMIETKNPDLDNRLEWMIRENIYNQESIQRVMHEFLENHPNHSRRGLYEKALGIECINK
ncbi:MAG: hypothetical protein EXS67_05915 [Candidatus Margulisbacteria bacterium]|nr:hypothetical protein [Candidatus Margulisiibacteriota bacterium]